MKVNLDVRALLLLTEGQSAEEVEESADLLKCQVVHVVQNPLRQMSLNKTAATARKNTHTTRYECTLTKTAY